MLTFIISNILISEAMAWGICVLTNNISKQLQLVIIVIKRIGFNYLIRAIVFTYVCFYQPGLESWEQKCRGTCSHQAQ